VTNLSSSSQPRRVVEPNVTLPLQIQFVTPALRISISGFYPQTVLFTCLVLFLRRLRVFENKVMRRIFGPKRDEVTGEWRKLHSEELHNLY
jgi:hypothetical protein